MRDLRPDLVFVVNGAVWRDFLRLREDAGGALCNGFLWACEERIAAAENVANNEEAAHFRAVLSLGTQYGLSFVSAVEVDGELIREEPKHSALRYPDDDDLTRIAIGSMAAHVILHRAGLRSHDGAWSMTEAVHESNGDIRVRSSGSERETQIIVSADEVETLRQALLRRLPKAATRSENDTLTLLALEFTSGDGDEAPEEVISAFLTSEGIPHRTMDRQLSKLFS